MPGSVLRIQESGIGNQEGALLTEEAFSELEETRHGKRTKPYNSAGRCYLFRQLAVRRPKKKEPS